MLSDELLFLADRIRLFQSAAVTLLVSGEFFISIIRVPQPSTYPLYISCPGSSVGPLSKELYFLSGK